PLRGALRCPAAESGAWRPGHRQQAQDFSGLSRAARTERRRRSLRNGAALFALSDYAGCANGWKTCVLREMPGIQAGGSARVARACTVTSQTDSANGSPTALQLFLPDGK